MTVTNPLRSDCWDRGVNVDESMIDREVTLRDWLTSGLEPDTVLTWGERWIANPERIFEIQVNGERWLGLKTISDYVLENGIPGIFCSRVRWLNLVGPLLSHRITENGVQVRARAASETARREMFDQIDASTEIVHPFPKMEANGVETGTPPQGWFVSEERASFLGIGELHLRAYTAEVLGDRWPVGQTITAYDPACSTGEFLSAFAQACHAEVFTVGQDLSAQMTEYARPRLDRVHTGDAIEPCVEPGSVDVIFLRFLNSEVVTSAEAQERLAAVVPCLKPDGVLVAFGHTPLLLDAHDLTEQGLTLERRTGRQGDTVFQFYIATGGQR